METESNKRVN